MRDPISRRQAISYGLGAAAARALAGRDRLLRGSGRGPRTQPAPGLPQPVALRSRDGELVVRLTGRPGVVAMNAPKPVTTYTFDGTVPGHTWEIRPGDTLRVRLRNRLPKLPPMPVRMDRPHEWTNMNLHTHGLHVSPAGNADNVFIDIPPGEDHQYEIHVPADHPAGIHWYHPHRHGGVAQQLPDPADVLMLSAGNRVEVLVKAGKPGTYDLVLTPGSSQKPNIPGMPPSGHPGAANGGMPMPGFPVLKGELDPRTILTVEVAGRGTPMSLPAALPAWDPPILPIARHRHFSFSVQRTPGNEFLNFGVDDKPYGMSAPPYQVPLGTAEEWTLENAFDPKLMEHAHVFHIHTNPFKVTRRNGKVLSPPLWRDTCVLTKSAGDTITFESNFADYTGKLVEHCHVLSHEDLGMMSAIEVVRPPAGRAAAEGQ
jgi:FtsP/CotA-like multicopper oxidase with cupredoxin domain